MNLIKEFGQLYDHDTLRDLQLLYDQKAVKQFSRLNEDVGLDPIEELPFPVAFNGDGPTNWVIEKLGIHRFIEKHWERLVNSPIELVFVVHDTAGIANQETGLLKYLITEWGADNTGTGIEDDHNHWHNVFSCIVAALKPVFEAKRAFGVGDKVLSRGSGSFGWIFRGLDRTKDLPYADNQFVIHVNSYGALGARNAAIEAAIDEITAKGQVFLASAGNSGHDTGGDSRVGFPASYEKAIAVGALDPDFKRKWYSSTGTEVYSTCGSGVPCINKDGTISTREGTSFSQPINAAIVGLIALYEGRKLTQAEVKEILRTRSIDLGEQGRDTFFGYGIQTDETFADPGDDPGEGEPTPPGTPKLQPYALDTTVHEITERWYYEKDMGTGVDPNELMIRRLHLSVKTQLPASLAAGDISGKVRDWMSRHILVVPNDWSENQVASITTRFIDMKMDQLHGITVDPKALDVWFSMESGDHYTLSEAEIGRWKNTPEQEIAKLGVKLITA
ncbi:MAG: S8 family serine peptidase [Bacteroidota bacterium]